MYVLMSNKGRIVLAQDHPVNLEALQQYTTDTENKYQIVELVDRTIEDIFQHVVRPRMLQQETMDARVARNIVALNQEGFDLMNFILASIATLQYIYEAEWKYSNRIMEEKMEENLLKWLAVKKELLVMSTSEDIINGAKDIHTEIIKWQTALIKLAHEFDKPAAPAEEAVSIPMNDEIISDPQEPEAAETPAPEPVHVVKTHAVEESDISAAFFDSLESEIGTTAAEEFVRTFVETGDVLEIKE